MRVLTATIAVFPFVLLAFPSIVVAQESRVYVGGTFNFVTQTHSDREPIGGTTQGGSALIGVQVSPRVAIEFEPSLAGRYSWPPSISHRICTWSLRFGFSCRRQERRRTRPTIRSASRPAPVHLYSGTVPARECRFDVEGPNNLS